MKYVSIKIQLAVVLRGRQPTPRSEAAFQFKLLWLACIVDSSGTSWLANSFPTFYLA